MTVWLKKDQIRECWENRFFRIT